MKFKEFESFREYERKVFEISNISDKYKKILETKSYFEPYHGVLYIDRECGVTLRIIGDSNNILDDTVFLVRAEAFENANFKLIENPNDYQRKILHQIEENYYNSNDIELLNDTVIDNFRHPYYPNDVVALLPTEKGLEQMWVRLKIKPKHQNLYIGELLNNSDIKDSYKAGSNVAMGYYDFSDEALIITNLVEIVEK